MARFIGMQDLASQFKFGSSYQQQPGSHRSVKESGSSQHLQAYRRSVSLCSGLRNLRKAQPQEDLHD